MNTGNKRLAGRKRKSAIRRIQPQRAAYLLPLSSLLCCLGSSAAALVDPLAFDYFDRLRANPDEFGVTSVEFKDGSHVAKVTVNETANTTRTYRLVNLATFMPFHKGTRESSFSEFAVSLLAIHHFNYRSFDPIAKQISNDCNVRFTTDAHDTNSERIGTAAETSNLLDREPQSLSNPLPSAIIGSRYSSISQPQAILAAIQNIAQVSPASTSANLENKELFPLFARTCPSSEGEAAAIVDYYIHLGVSRVSLLYWSDAFGAALQRAFQERATAVGMETNYAGFNSVEAIPAAIQKLRGSKFQHIFVVAFSSKYQAIMEEAYRAGMADGQHAWLFYGPSQFNIQKLAQSPPDSPLFKASKGVAVVNFEATPQRQIQKPGQVRQDEPLPETLVTVNDFFRAEWNRLHLDPILIEYLQKKLPEGTEMENGEYPESYDMPSVWAYLQYDAILAVGVAMCQAETEFFNAFDFIQKFQTVSFEGTSGQVEFNEYNTREYSTVKFTVWNMLPDEEGGLNEKGEQGFCASPTMYYTGDGKWLQFRPFVYADGQTVPPPDLAAIEGEVDTINDSIRWIGIALAIFIILGQMGCLLWTWGTQDHPVVLASQPAFLTMISVGSIVQAAAIFPLSVDRSLASQNDNDSHFDKACMAVPWLYYMGLSITCSALYAKTSRLVEILRTPELDRMFLQPSDFLLWPFLVIGVNSIVLTLWTLLGPLQYDVIPDGSTDVHGRLLASYGMCRSRDVASDPNWFWVSLLLVNVGSLLTANMASWLSRGIETEYHESQYIAFALGMIVEAFVIGSAMQHATDDSPDANYVISIGSIFISSFVTAVLIFVPKMIVHRESLRTKAEQAKIANTPRRMPVGSTIERFRDHESSEFSDGDAVSSGELRRGSARTTLTISQEPDIAGTSGVKVTHHPSSALNMGGVFSGSGSDRAFFSRRGTQ